MQIWKKHFLPRIIFEAFQALDNNFLGFVHDPIKIIEADNKAIEIPNKDGQFFIFGNESLMQNSFDILINNFISLPRICILCYKRLRF